MRWKNWWAFVRQHRADVAMGQLLQFETEPQRQTGTAGRDTEILHGAGCHPWDASAKRENRPHGMCEIVSQGAVGGDLRFPKGMLYEDYAVIYKVMQRMQDGGSGTMSLCIITGCGAVRLCTSRIAREKSGAPGHCSGRHPASVAELCLRFGKKRSICSWSLT